MAISTHSRVLAAQARPRVAVSRPAQRRRDDLLARCRRAARHFWLIAVLVGATSTATNLAFAASVTGTDRDVASGFTVVAPCQDLTTAEIAWSVKTNSAVMGVEISGLGAGCNGAVASITLTDSSNASVGSQSGVTVASGSAVFSTLSANPSPSTVTNVNVTVVGP